MTADAITKGKSEACSRLDGDEKTRIISTESGGIPRTYVYVTVPGLAQYIEARRMAGEFDDEPVTAVDASPFPLDEEGNEEPTLPNHGGTVEGGPIRKAPLENLNKSGTVRVSRRVAQMVGGAP